MNRIVAIGCVFLFPLLLAGGACFASTDLISNALTQSNSFLKQAGLVQRKYSGIARKMVTTKVSVDPEKLMSNKAQKLKEKAENAAEKASKVQDRIETAKERKEELTAKYNELNAKAMELKGKADKAIAKGAEIRGQYQNFQKKVTGAIEDVKDAKAKAEGTIGDIKEAAGALNDAASAVADVASAKISQKISAVTGKDDASESPSVVSNEEITTIEAEPETVSAGTASDRAETLRSAALLAETSDPAETPLEVPITALSAAMPEEISVSDVMASVSKTPEKNENAASQATSPLSLQEQLLQSSTSSNKPTESRENSAAEQINTLQSVLSTNRNRFEDMPNNGAAAMSGSSENKTANADKVVPAEAKVEEKADAKDL